LTATDAVYAIWIGTNDLGVWAFLTDSQVPGKVLTDYTDCVYQSLDGLYKAGARAFVLMNAAPLQLAPLYANDTLNGVGDNQYWPMKPSNKTQVADNMHEYTTSVNNIYKYQTPFEALISQRYPGANFANFDVWQLISDIYDNPSTYLNGTEPPNVQGFEHHCSVDQKSCTLEYNGTSPDSFLWYDELHPR
jgi:phospholipase/lecithinase/hemolysin